MFAIIQCNCVGEGFSYTCDDSWLPVSMMEILDHDWLSNLQLTGFACWSWCDFWVACFCWTFLLTSGRRRSSRVRICRWRNNVVGATPVVACGVAWYVIRNSTRRCEGERPSFSVAFIARLKVWTKRSASLFEDGWYGAQRMCFIPFFFANVANLAETIANCGRLSETICSSNPYYANILRRGLTVSAVVVVVISTTSGHLEWASMTLKSMRPWKGPAKSMWILVHGKFGHNHGCRGAAGGNALTVWQGRHAWAIFSIALSMPFH